MPDVFLNERLMSDLRPTLFLAQLSNLLAGNISIVHGVTGSSRTFMGEEAAGVDAVRIALARIAAGQSELALVGGAHNGEREDLLLLYDVGGHMLRGAFAPVWERTGRAAAWCSVRSARSSCRRRATTPRRATPSRWRGCQAVQAGPLEPAVRRKQGHARADVAERSCRRPRAGRVRGDLRRDRRRARDRGGAAVLAAPTPRRPRTCHRFPSRPRDRVTASR